MDGAMEVASPRNSKEKESLYWHKLATSQSVIFRFLQKQAEKRDHLNTYGNTVQWMGMNRLKTFGSISDRIRIYQLAPGTEASEKRKRIIASLTSRSHQDALCSKLTTLAAAAPSCRFLPLPLPALALLAHVNLSSFASPRKPSQLTPPTPHLRSTPAALTRPPPRALRPPPRQCHSTHPSEAELPLSPDSPAADSPRSRSGRASAAPSPRACYRSAPGSLPLLHLGPRAPSVSERGGTSGKWRQGRRRASRRLEVTFLPSHRGGHTPRRQVERGVVLRRGRRVKSARRARAGNPEGRVVLAYHSLCFHPPSPQVRVSCSPRLASLRGTASLSCQMRLLLRPPAGTHLSLASRYRFAVRDLSASSPRRSVRVRRLVISGRPDRAAGLRPFSKILTLRIMQFSNAASWTLSSAPLGMLKGKAMESGTSAGYFRERQLKLMEEFLGAKIPILVHTALFLGLEKIT
ncbi:uncharacterized protein LOC133914861 [Phragmites australis]|uniref:uncharacterized protein LOC133914861 n=1 Tax=Phragmites australis TaxID=29695 RepID=UPI002D77E52D|nr:uncharacterized protein LOC133914861 [Phragmites australis]